MQNLESLIATILERNRRVEADKAWETSWARRLIISCGIYVSALFFFATTGMETPWLEALIPSGAYILSTLSLPWVKQWWIRCFASKSSQP